MLSPLAVNEFVNVEFNGPKNLSTASPGPKLDLLIAVDDGALTISHDSFPGNPMYASILLVVVLYLIAPDRLEIVTVSGR
jgi:hypothetical protein